MSDDALGMFQAMRPQAPGLNSDMRRSGGAMPSGMPDLHNLAMVPGTPGYNARIPKPPCYKCGEDHVPNVDYGHPWEGEPVHDEPVAASAIMRRPVSDVPAASAEIPMLGAADPPSQRVALYVGRGDTYVIAAECSPDWETVRSFKVTADLVLPMIQLARALGIKVQDKTGGDLVMLEEEAADAWRKSAENHERGAKGAGDRQPRRQGQRAAGAQEDKPGESLQEAG